MEVIVLKTNLKVKQIIFVLLLALLPLNLSSCAAKASAAPVTLTGIVTDVHCYLKKPDITLDTKQCLMMPACSTTGYGVVVVQPDNTTQFYFLDGEFAPAATGSQKKMFELIAASTRVDHFYYTVTGVVSADKKTIAYDKSYPVITVSNIVESDGK